MTVPVPARVRPTSGRVREALMSTWQDRLPGARLLDLFAGSGAVGLEAIGWGAEHVVGLEVDSRVLAELERSYERWGAGRARALRASLPRDLGPGLERLRLERLRLEGPRRGEPRFDLIFADPPYDFADFESLVRVCDPLLEPAGELIVEHSARTSLPESVGDLARVRSRRYGESALSAYRHVDRSQREEEE